MNVPATPTIKATPALVDPFGRAITYVRVSVTDRCDFRCVYCMSEHMTFLPKPDLLTLEELDRIKARFSLIIIDACRDNPLRSRGSLCGRTGGLRREAHQRLGRHA